MGIHLLAIVAARGFLQVFQVSAPLLWPLNLWLPSPRHLPEACAVFCGAVASHAAWLRAACRRLGSSGSGSGVDEYLRHALLSITYSH